MPGKKTRPAAALEEAPSATENNTLTLEKKDNPKHLDRLYVPGMVDNVDGEDAGIAAPNPGCRAHAALLRPRRREPRQHLQLAVLRRDQSW